MATHSRILNSLTGLSLGLVLVVGGSDSSAAQIALSHPDSTLPQKHRHLFHRQDAYLAGGMTVAMFALFPVDKRLAQELQDSSTQANRFLNNSAKGVELIASPGAYYIGGGLYLVGRLGNMPRIADLGWHGTEAVLFGEGLGYLLKGAMGRARPFLTADTIPRDFDWGRGFKDGNWRSFPSGHTTTAFAAAAAVTDETTVWWPNSTWIIGPAMYGGATLVGLSLMYHNKHWASDVALGAIIGTFSGKKVVLWSHDNPNNALDRVMLGARVGKGSSGRMNFGFVLPLDESLRVHLPEQR